jgi:DNA-binding transcriptional LysR family regulator
MQHGHVKLRQLRHFVAVAETLNFRRAAERVNLSQQAVSKSIIQLEEQLGLRLLERGRQSVLLTEQGRHLLPHAIEVISAARRFDDAVTTVSDSRIGRLAIGATPTFLESIIPDALDAFRQLYPETPVTVERGDFSSLSALMVRGELDLIVSTAPEELPRHLLKADIIGQDRNIIVVRSNHPLATGQAITVQDLSAYPQVKTMNYPRGATYAERIFAACGQTPPRPALTVGSTLLALDRVEQTESWWITPQLQVRHRLERGAFTALTIDPPDESWDLILAARRHAILSPWAAAFGGLVRNCLAEAKAH